MAAPAFARMTFLAGVFAFAAPCVAADAADTVRHVDVKHSSANFSISHVYVSDVEGTVPIVSGNVVFAPGATIPSKIDATLDPRGIHTGEDERDGELQGEEWFDTKAFPLWTFKSTKISGDAQKFMAEGILTVHGVGQPVTLVVLKTADGPPATFTAVGHADRHGFGMNVTRTDMLVGTDITITLKIVLSKEV